MARPDPTVLRWALLKLSAAFPVSFRDEAAVKAKGVLLAELWEQHPWIDATILRKAVFLAAWQHKGEFAPPPATLLDFCEVARVEVEREARALSRTLPPPAPPTEDERQQAEDRVVAAKLRARLSLPERLRAKRRDAR